MVKKAYIKPDVYCESFEMSQHVATCAWDMKNQSNKNNCAAESDPEFLYEGGVFLFVDENICNLLESEYEDYCYTNGGAGNNVFNS